MRRQDPEKNEGILEGCDCSALRLSLLFSHLPVSFLANDPQLTNFCPHQKRCNVRIVEQVRVGTL